MSVVPRCKECNKMYKRNEVNEYGLCSKCLVEKVNIKVDKFQIHTAGEEQPFNPQEIMPEGMEIDAPYNDKSVDENIINLTNANIKHEQINKGTVKPGQAIRTRFAELIGKGLITDAVLLALTNKEETAKTLGIRYAFLKALDITVSIKETTWVSGHARYSSRPIEIDGKQYVMTNDLYSKSLPRFMEWADSIDKNK